LSYRGLRLPKRTEVLNIRLPDDLILELDSLVEKKAFKSRSEAIREFAREYVQGQMRVEEKNKKSGHGGEGW
jgi:metal-responsive CopG/Arc/MetJ family transcriptional regulator